MFTEIMGLPAHALIVHAAVVFIPLAVLAAIAYALVPFTRRHIWWIVLALAIVAPGAAWAARLSGDQYRAYWVDHGASGEFLNKIDIHQSFGNTCSLWTTGLGVVMLALVLYAIPRPVDAGGSAVAVRPRALVLVTVVVTVVVALITAYYVYKTGDAGARATHPTIS